MEKDFKDYLIKELEYLRESMDLIKSSCVTREEFDSNKKITTGWFVGMFTLFISIIFGVVAIMK